MQRNTRLGRLARDERGFSVVFVGLGMMAMVAASMLAIDVGMLMTARNQAQNSADAGALGGATALVFDDWNDRTATGPAVTNALSASRGNQVMGGNVSVTVPDVEFLNDPAGVNNRVKVTVYRENLDGTRTAIGNAQLSGGSFSLGDKTTARPLLYRAVYTAPSTGIPYAALSRPLP
jgi:Flp pilus assembly protein TadG